MAQRRTGRVPVKVLARSMFWIVVLVIALVAGSPIVWLMVAGGLVLGMLVLLTTRGRPQPPVAPTESEQDDPS
jgi:hypothetical protein